MKIKLNINTLHIKVEIGLISAMAYNNELLNEHFKRWMSLTNKVAIYEKSTNTPK